MITVKSSINYRHIFEESEQKPAILGKLALEGSFMDFVNWLKDNQSIVKFTESAFVINKAQVTDEELQNLVKLMCKFTGRSLSFYFNDLENQWILSYKPYINDLLPIIEGVSS